MRKTKLKGARVGFPDDMSSADIANAIAGLFSGAEDEKDEIKNLLGQCLEQLKNHDLSSVVEAVKGIEIPDQKESFMLLAEKLDSLSESPAPSNDGTIEALSRIESALKASKKAPISKKTREIKGFTISKRDLLGKVKDVKFIYEDA